MKNRFIFKKTFILIYIDLILCKLAQPLLSSSYHEQTMLSALLDIPVIIQSIITSQSCFVQSNASHSLTKLATASFCDSMLSCLRRRCMSSAGRRSMPLIMLSPKLLLNSFSSSITCTNPLFSPNSTWKYGKFLGIEPRNPFSLVSMSFFALCWLHSSSASSIACRNYVL